MPRRRIRDDRGITLTELLIVMMIFGVLMIIVTSVMIAITNLSKDTVGRARAVEEARLGLAQIDRQVRSGNVILNPANEGIPTAGVPPWFSMRIHTQEDGLDRCAQWRVKDHDGDGFGDLEFRTWDPAYPNVQEWTTWSPVAHNLIAMDVSPVAASDIKPGQPETWPPFWVNTSIGGDTDFQRVQITLRLKDPSEDGSSKATSLSSTVTGRNTVIGYPSTYCSVAPPP
jgi:prepilin-type N-terminal cleavage/methylation domain-containing protein